MQISRICFLVVFLGDSKRGRVSSGARNTSSSGSVKASPPLGGIPGILLLFRTDVRHRLQSIEMVPIADGFRYLGVQYSP